MTTKHETVGPCGRSERESGEHFDKAHWGQAADATWFDMFDRRQREQTAAFILAALIQGQATMDAAGDTANPHSLSHQQIVSLLVPSAVALADALRAALAKGTP
jgi:hypothetical protein